MVRRSCPTDSITSRALIRAADVTGSRTTRKIGAAKIANRTPATRKVCSAVASSTISTSATKIVPIYPTATPIPDSLPRVEGRLTTVSVAS